VVSVLRRRLHPRRRRAVAIDIGTARIRLGVVGGRVWVDEPTLLAYPRGEREARVGWAAWDSAVAGPARLCYPVRRGVVVDRAAAIAMLQRQLRALGPMPARVAVAVTSGRPAASGIRMTGTDTDTDTPVVVAAATGAAVLPIEAPLAAVIGAGLDVVGRPRLVLDIGAGSTALAVIADGRVAAAQYLPFGVGRYLDQSKLFLDEVRRALREVLDAVDAGDAADAAAGDLCLVGGGALLPGLAPAVNVAAGMDVRTPQEPHLAVLRGLLACAENPATAWVPA
jgi:actin-like ATPase involved in cell morphogenesis